MVVPWKRRLSRDSDAMRHTALALVLALAAAPSALAWTVDEAYQAFRDAGYGDCEAFILAKYWIVDLGEAKVRGGTMILDGRRPQLDAELGQAEAMYDCVSPDALDDAGTLADLWTGIW